MAEGFKTPFASLLKNQILLQVVVLERVYELVTYHSFHRVRSHREETCWCRRLRTENVCFPQQPARWPPRRRGCGPSSPLTFRVEQFVDLRGVDAAVIILCPR